MRDSEVLLSTVLTARKLRAELYISTDAPALTARYPHYAIGKVAVQSTVAKEPSGSDQDLFYLGLENIESTTGEIINAQRIGAQNIQSRSKIFRDGQIVYGRLRPYLRKAAIVPAWIPMGLCSTEFIVLEPDSKIVDPIFLRALLVSDYVTAEATRLQAGSSLPRVSARDFLAIKIPVPSIDIQRVIANRLQKIHNERSELLEKVTACDLESTKLMKRFYSAASAAPSSREGSS